MAARRTVSCTDRDRETGDCGNMEAQLSTLENMAEASNRWSATVCEGEGGWSEVDKLTLHIHNLIKYRQIRVRVRVVFLYIFGYLLPR